LLLAWIAWPLGILVMPRPLEGGISELRIHFGPGYRIYFRKLGKTVIVLLCGGDKGSQAKDIRTAKRLIHELE
jgi:putative addiction module killer protein